MPNSVKSGSEEFNFTSELKVHHSSLSYWPQISRPSNPRISKDTKVPSGHEPADLNLTYLTHF